MNKSCKEEGCLGEDYVRGRCKKHYLANWHLQNRTRRLSANKTWYKANRDKHLARTTRLTPEARARKDALQKARRESDPLGYRNNNLKVRYNITHDEYLARLLANKGCCEICGANEPRSKHTDKFAVDHEHTSGLVRGILCHPCNWALGQLKDSPAIIRKAAEYLEKTAVGCWEDLSWHR